MIASFFRSLEDHNVEYLLISGQATVLYGAASFSEDIDLWVNPTEPNRCAFLSALAARHACYYKATPPFELEALRAGHGFHFTVPDDPEFFLDVMGRPPRVGAFAQASARSRTIDTPWGALRVAGIRDLVEIKKTQRVGDYPVIGQLVLRCLAEIGEPDEADCEWALANVFTLAELTELATACPAVCRYGRADPELGAYLAAIADEGEATAEITAAAERRLLDRMAACQRRDREYWRAILAELRRMNRDGKLLRVGTPVRAA
ncbi:MAG: hypothetical protein JXR37_27925 [Kiritimatiellae bacterium]|nr:hypothetical protein [Kiritimatiellia bacterium]